MPTLRAAAIVAALLLAVAARAGTEADPEVTDAASDQATAVGGLPACPAPPTACQFTFGDVVSGWVSEAGDDFVFSIVTTGGIGGGQAGGVATTSYLYHFHAEYDGTAVTASGRSTAASVEPEGDATAASRDAGYLVLLVPRAALGDPPAGGTLTGLFVETAAYLGADPATLVVDRGPDDGFGRDYTVGGAAGPGGAPVLPVLLLTAQNTSATTPANASVDFVISVGLGGNVSTLAGAVVVDLANGTLPGDWTVSFAPDQVSLDANATTAAVTATVAVPAAAPVGDHVLPLRASALDGNATAVLNVTVTVAAPVDGDADDQPEGGDDARTDDEDGRGLPAAGVLWVAVGVAVALGVRRQRAG
jgi:hypothetical protein